METVSKTTFAGITPLSAHGQNGIEETSVGDAGVENFYPSMEEASKQIYEVGCTSCLCFQEVPTVFGRERFFVINFSNMVNVPKQCRYRFVNHETERQRKETVGLLLKNHKSSKMHAVRIHSRIQVGMSDEQAEVNRKMVKKYYQARQKHCKDLMRCYLDTVAAFPEIQVCWNAHYLPNNHMVIKNGVDLFSTRLWAKGKARVLDLIRQGKLKHLMASEQDVKMASFIYETTCETDAQNGSYKQAAILNGSSTNGAGDGAPVADLLNGLTGKIYTCNTGGGSGNTGSQGGGNTPASTGSGQGGGTGQPAGKINQGLIVTLPA